MLRMFKSFCRFGRVVLFTGSLLASAMPGRTASYYVDYGSGSDANNGVSTNSPWQHCPGDPTASGTAAGTSLAAGDTVFFKGGVAYAFGKTGIALNWAGGAGNPITYDGNSAGTWGTGKALMTDNYGTNHIAAFFSNGGMTNVVINNFAVGPLGGAATLPADPTGTAYAPNGIPPNPGCGVSAGFMNGVVISSCDFSNIGYYGWTYPLGNSSLNGAAVACFGCNGLTITNCTVSQMRTGFYINNSGQIANLTIAGCTLSLIEEWAITLNTGVNAYLSNVYIFNCVFTNTDQSWPSWSGYGDHPHRDTIFSFGAEGCSGNCALQRNVTDTNVCIYNNYFVDTLGYEGGSTVIWFEDNASVNIYNNVFNNTKQLNAAVQLTEPSTNSLWRAAVYNNTFYLSDYSMCVAVTAGPVNNYTWPINPADHSQMVTIENNIIYEYSGATAYANAYDYTVGGSTTITNNVNMDYNLYRTGNVFQGQMVYGFWSQYFGYMTPNAARLSGWDTNSLFGLNPLFMNPAGNDFHVAANSPVMSKGLNLSGINLPGLSSDRDGIARPTNGPWALGAYQTPGPGVKVPPQVQGLHIVHYY
jgi:hypothetical protein